MLVNIPGPMDPMGFIFGVGSHQGVKQILPFMRVPIRLWVLDGFEIAFWIHLFLGGKMGVSGVPRYQPKPPSNFL